VVEGIKRGKYAPKQPGLDKNSAKNRWFPTVLDLKTVENTVLYSKVLKKIYFPDGF
jgi:hypothetical protein